MVQLTINQEGSLYLEQWCMAPTVYFDHWAWVKISKNETLATRFSKALKSREGTLALSWLNLVEFSTVTDEHQRRAADTLLNELSPRFFVVTPDFFKVISAEDKMLAGKEPADLGMLREFVDLSDQNSLMPFSLRKLFQRVPATIAQDCNSFADLVIQKVRSFRQEYAEDERFRKRVLRLPNGTDMQHGTRFIARELIGALLKDNTARFDRNDAVDLCHAVVPLAYCDYVLLDRRWSAMAEQVQNKIRDGGLSFPMAKAISEKNNGLERFLQELESGGQN